VFMSGGDVIEVLNTGFGTSPLVWVEIDAA
jgi:hypothetical protein